MARKSRPKSTPPDAARPLSDEELWQSELSGTRPLEDGRRGGEPPAGRSHSKQAAPDLARLVDDAGTFDVRAEGERVLGRAPDANERLLRRLARGEIPRERTLDLHGFRLAAAEDELARVIEDARRAGQRCLCVVTGRGRHDEGSGVIRQSLPGWLSTPPLAAQVLAFCTALPQDGGMGASYVLLRT